MFEQYFKRCNRWANKICRRIAVTICMAAVLAGCSGAEWNSINRQFSPTMGDSRLIDAKQRAIISVRRPEFDSSGKLQVGTSLAVCAEPSPDVIQATAASLAGSASSEQLQGLFRLALSSSDGAASFGLRTQSIQLLRDAYYRLCEAYLSDGIDSIAYDVLQRRYQNQITALLAIEQLTGPVVGSQAAIGTGTAADAGGEAALLQQQLEKAQREEAELEAEIADAQTREASLEERKATLEASIPARAEEIEAQNTILTAGGDDATTEVARASLVELEAEQAVEIAELEAIPAMLNETQRFIKVKADALPAKSALVANLDKAFQAAAQSTVTSLAFSTPQLAAGTRAAGSPGSEVANAVRAIALNAMNQHYQAQVCFESMRGRNHASRVKNNSAVPTSTSSYKDLSGREFASAFELYCSNLFSAEVERRRAEATALSNRASNITAVLDKIGVGNAQIEAQEAANLIFAINYATPLNDTTEFMSRQFGLPVVSTSAATNTGVATQVTAGSSGDVQQSKASPAFVPSIVVPAAPSLIESYRSP